MFLFRKPRGHYDVAILTSLTNRTLEAWGMDTVVAEAKVTRYDIGDSDRSGREDNDWLGNSVEVASELGRARNSTNS